MNKPLIALFTATATNYLFIFLLNWNQPETF